MLMAGPFFSTPGYFLIHQQSHGFPLVANEGAFVCSPEKKGISPTPGLDFSYFRN
jgi:hypothetical protein